MIIYFNNQYTVDTALLRKGAHLLTEAERKGVLAHTKSISLHRTRNGAYLALLTSRRPSDLFSWWK